MWSCRLRNKSSLEEVQHLTATLAPTLWADWPSQFPPFILRTRGHEILIGHPHPPADFIAPTREHGVWARPTNDTTDVQATYPVNGVVTAVMSAPGASDDAASWVLKAAHEVFHCYQGTARIRDPFVGKFGAYNDLSFPYPYEDPNLAAALRLEAEVVFQLATADPNDATVLSPRRPGCCRCRGALSGLYQVSPPFRNTSSSPSGPKALPAIRSENWRGWRRRQAAIDRHPRSRGRFLRPVTTTSFASSMVTATWSTPSDSSARASGVA